MAVSAAAGETDGILPISDKQPPAPAPTPTKTNNKTAAETAGEALAVLLMLALLIAALVGVAYLSIGAVHLFSRWGTELTRPYDPVQYTVTIASVSGLDPVKDLHHHPSSSSSILLVDPVFNLTLSVSSPRTAARRECVKAGTAVEVSYSYYLRRRSAAVVRQASGTTPGFCVEVGEEEEGAVVVAWGDGVRLPGFVADSLAADVQPEFEVRFTPPIPYCTGGYAVCSTTVHVLSCSAAKVGGGPVPCRFSTETVNFPPPPRPGRE